MLILTFAKLTSQELEWANSLGGANGDVGNSIVTDNSGNVYVTGYFIGTSDFDPGVGTYNLVSNGSADIFFAKYSKNGDLVWAKSIGGVGIDISESIEIDATGNVYITGTYSNTVDFDPSAGTQNLTSNGNTDVFYAKYKNNGDLVWAKSIGGVGVDQASSIDIDASGNVHIVGVFNGTVDFNPDAGILNITSNGSTDIFFSKYNRNGNLIWANSIGSVGNDVGSSIKIDALGNVYITGSFTNTADFDTGIGTFNLISNGGYDIFFAKYNSLGKLNWAKSVGGIDNDRSIELELDSKGRIYITGFFNNTVDFNPDIGTFDLTSIAQDIFFAKYSNYGELFWARGIGGGILDQGTSIVTDALGNVYITGFFRGTADFDPSTNTLNLTSAGNSDIFYTKYNERGSLEWAKSIGDNSVDQGNSILVDASGYVYIVGVYSGTADFDPGAGTTNLTSAGGTDVFYAKYNQFELATITTNAISLIGPNSALSGGIISNDGYAFVTARGVVWDINPNPTIALSTKTNNGTGTGSFVSSITGLNNNTTYYVRAYATNSEGTSYGIEYTFTTTTSIELDGNQDGILDSTQNYVYTFKYFDIFDFTNTKLMTIVDLNNYTLSEVSSSKPIELSYYYPYGFINFKVQASQTQVKIYFHGTSSFAGYNYRKLFADNLMRNYDFAEFGSEILGGSTVATVTLTLIDGGIGDSDGIVNGIITDPGGPAILASTNIPTLSEWARIVLISMLLILGVWKIRKYV